MKVKPSKLSKVLPGKKAQSPVKANRAGAKAKKSGADKQVPEINEKRVNKRQQWIMMASVIAAAILVIGVSIGALCSYQPEPEPETPPEVSQEPEPEPEEPEEELPTENPDDLVPQPEVTDNAAYQVAAYKPRYLSIPSIGLYNIPIVEIGVNGDTLGDPDNYRLVGWHYTSALPGQQGVAMIDGHGGDLGNGIFRPLPRVPIGSDVIIEMGDGRKFTYRVVEKVNRTRGKDADAYMHTAYQSPQPGVPALTLITCTGAWLRNEQTYLERLFVRAVLVQ